MNIEWMLITGWLFCSLIMFLLYFVQRHKNDATIVDVGWSLLIGVLAVFYAWMLPIQTVPQFVALFTALLWSMRLTYYLWINRVMGSQSEDGRYQAVRQKWGNKAQLFFIVFFQAQSLIALLFSIPVLMALLNNQPMVSVYTLIGAAFGLGAVIGESVADHQLAAFRSNPKNKGKTCRTGLWHYSRHPNYFFEWLHWFAYIFFAYPAPYWWITTAGPFIMLLFLFRLTGIPYTEKQALTSRGDDYKQYQRTTSVFIPWFTKEDKR